MTDVSTVTDVTPDAESTNGDAATPAPPKLSKPDLVEIPAPMLASVESLKEISKGQPSRVKQRATEAAKTVGLIRPGSSDETVKLAPWVIRALMTEIEPLVATRTDPLTDGRKIDVLFLGELLQSMVADKMAPPPGSTSDSSTWIQAEKAVREAPHIGDKPVAGAFVRLLTVAGFLRAKVARPRYLIDQTYLNIELGRIANFVRSYPDPAPRFDGLVDAALETSAEAGDAAAE